MSSEANAAKTTETMSLYEPILIAVCAYVYSVILTEQEMIFNKLYLFAENKLPRWLSHPLISCVYCVAGQMALWYYLVKYWENYNLIYHILYICFAIFTVDVILRIFKYLQNERPDKN